MNDRTFALDDRKLFCRHCGRASWLHRPVRGVGLKCVDPAALADASPDIGKEG